MIEQNGRQRQAEAVRKLWADPEYKAAMSKKISDGWKRRMAAIEAAKPPKELYHVPDLPGEEWRDITGYEGLYSVSNMGRVKGLHRDLPHKTYGTWHIRERLLKQSWTGYREDHSDGYLFVFLHKNNSQNIYRVHRLVAETFIPRIEGKNVVNHKDCNRGNNTVENLEWCTPLENTRHAMSHNRADHSYHSKKVKLSPCSTELL